MANRTRLSQGLPPRPLPSPLRRTLGGAKPEWKGREGEVCADPVTPGVSWIGGAQGGARVDGAERLYAPLGPANGGDVTQCPHNFELRALNLEAIQVSFQNLSKIHGLPWGYRDWDEVREQRLVRESAALPRPDPNWVNPLEECGGDTEKMRNLTHEDLVQNSMRLTEEEMYCSPPEKYGERMLIMDLLTSPWIFPFYSRLIPATSSARKYFARALAPTFRFKVPGVGTARELDREGFFRLVFQQLLPAFPDFSFNANFLTTTGLDDRAHVTVRATGTHTGAPFSILGLPAIPATGRSVALPIEFWRVEVDDLQVMAIAADGDEPQGFPTGVYTQLGGQLPGF